MNEVLGAGAGSWTVVKQNLLLGEFGLGRVDSGFEGPYFSDLVAGIASDKTLIEMYAIVHDIPITEVVRDTVVDSDDGNWKTDYFRLFASHSAAHKGFVSEVADELAVIGIHAFVAHDTMQVSRPWQEQIEQHLRTMQALVAFVHPEFNVSAWCHEEVGWALGRRVPHFVVRMGADPAAFIGRDQWPSCTGQNAKQVASVIGTWISGVPVYGQDIFERLLQGLRDAGNYYDAGAAAERIAALGELAEDQWDALREIYWANDQVHGGVLATRALEPFYRGNERTFPPPKPEEPPF